ncbi:hypothetical protein EU514_02825 [Pseudomonas fragi]|nr:hypothetical protein [Pseudomonas fragi]
MAGVLGCCWNAHLQVWERACSRLQHLGYSDVPSCQHREQARSHRGQQAGLRFHAQPVFRRRILQP